MKVLYCVSMIDDWVDVAEYFYEKSGWEPLLWQTTKENNDYVKSKFPNNDTIDFFEANRGNLEHMNLKKEVFLSEEVLDRYIKYERITIKMMDRMDPDGYSFNYSDRVHLYYNILEFVLNYIAIRKPELILFHDTPHFPFQYLIYAVAIENDIKILRFSPTHIKGKTFLSSTLGAEPAGFQKTFQDIKNNLSNIEVDNYIAKINGNYGDATPYYMSSINSSAKDSIFYKIVYAFLKSIKYLYKEKLSTKYFKAKNKSVREGFSNKDHAVSAFFASLYKIKLQKEYEKYVRLTSCDFNLDDKFIYFPLHYQPEKTTSPEGGVFVDQFLAINLLSKLSQGKSKIYVKEHISQFSQKLKGEQGRQEGFYRELSILENVVLIDVSVNSFLLMDKSIAVSTITGTAGFESVVRGKPSIIFGYPWYRGCSGVFFVENEETLHNALDQIFNNYKVDAERVRCFLHTIFDISEEIYLGPSELKLLSGKEHDNKKSIISLIEKYHLNV